MDNSLKIRRVSTVLRLACTAYLILSPVMLIAIWLNFSELADPTFGSNLPLRMEYIGTINLVAGFFVACIPTGLMLYGVWRLRQLFDLYQHGTLFTPANAGHLHAFATMLLINVIASPVVDILRTAALTMNYPEGERMISIDFSASDLSMLFLAGVMFAIAWIMREGHRLATENAEFV